MVPLMIVELAADPFQIRYRLVELGCYEGTKDLASAVEIRPDLIKRRPNWRVVRVKCILDR